MRSLMWHLRASMKPWTERAGRLRRDNAVQNLLDRTVAGRRPVRPLGGGAKPNRIRKAGRQLPISGTSARNSLTQSRERAPIQGRDQGGVAVLAHILQHEQGHHRLDGESLRASWPARPAAWPGRRGGPYLRGHPAPRSDRGPMS